MKRNIYTILAAAVVLFALSACEKDCNDTHINEGLMKYPTLLEGSFPVEVLHPALGDSIIFAPVLLDTTGARYQWILDGKEVSSDSVFVFKADQPCRGNIICRISNDYGSVEVTAEVVSAHDFSKGFFIQEQSTISFYDTSRGKLYRDCYGSLNGGAKMASGNYDRIMLSMEGGRIYAAVSTSTSNRDHVYMIDAATLYRQSSSVLTANIGAITNLNDRYGLVFAGGIYRMNLSNLTAVKLFSEYGWESYNSILYLGRLLMNDTYDNYESTVKWYDAAQLLSATENSLPAAEQMDIEQAAKFNFVKGADGCVYTVESKSGQYYLVKIKPDFSLEKTEMPFEPLLLGYGDKGNVLTAGRGGSDIYINASNGGIYKYVLGGSMPSAPFITVDGMDDSELCGTYVDQRSGELYLMYSTEVDWYEYEGKILIFTESGELSKTIDCGGMVPYSIWTK